MGKIIGSNWTLQYNENIINMFQNLKDNPINIFTTVLDIAIVVFLIYCFVKMVKGSRAWQLAKGIAFLIVATWISGLLNLYILALSKISATKKLHTYRFLNLTGILKNLNIIPK